MASERHLLRSIVVQTLFAWEFRGGDPESILNYNIVNGAGHLKDTTYSVKLLQKVLLHRNEIKALIEEYAPEWPYDHIAPLDRAVLQVGLAELLYDDKIPDLVAINEAIELAKEFGVESSSKFVNGVLSSIYDARRKTS